MENDKIHASQRPAHGQQVITACAFIYYDFDGIAKVFLPKRAETKKFLPGVYELPGGHIDYGEDIVDGLKRELREEFSMNSKIGEPLAVFTYINEIKGTHSIEVIYFVEFSGDIEKIKLNPEDHSSYVWIAENEIDSIMNENKKDDDPEIMAIRKGFAKLRGQSLFG